MKGIVVPSFRRWAALAATLAVVAALVAAGAPQTGAAVGVPPYSGPPVPVRENVVFLYQTPAEVTAAGQLAKIGHPRDIVFGAHTGDVVPGSADEVTLAHSLGAKAYKYIQLTWFPTAAATWMGTTAAQRAAWTLCRTGSTALRDANDGDGLQHPTEDWAYADLNEVGMANAVLAWTAQLKALGYDGVFIDNGGRSLHGPAWNATSTCTDSKIKPGIRSADAWMALTTRIRAQHLKVAIDWSSRTALPLTRPDPNNPGRIKTDVGNLSWVLHENVGHPKENYPGSDPAWVTSLMFPFETLVAGTVDDALNGRGQVVEMAKARLPATDPNRAKQDEYVWALAKLSGQPVALNAGFDYCGDSPGTTDCNRTGFNPSLTDLTLGNPIDSMPYQARCDTRGCMWVRRFQKGMVVASAYGTATRAAKVPLGVSGCRYVTAFNGGKQGGGKCVTTLDVGTGPTSRWGRVYLYSP